MFKLNSNLEVERGLFQSSAHYILGLPVDLDLKDSISSSSGGGFMEPTYLSRGGGHSHDEASLSSAQSLASLGCDDDKFTPLRTAPHTHNMQRHRSSACSFFLERGLFQSPMRDKNVNKVWNI